MTRRWFIAISIFVLIFICSHYPAANLAYTKTEGPFKNWMQVVDLGADGDPDVVVSQTRWEDVDILWAGVGRWVNQGNGTFELVREQGTINFAGYAAGAGNVERGGDTDVFVQDFPIRLLVNQGGEQARASGEFIQIGGINLPLGYFQGYRDMGGTITMGDLNGDGWIDAFVAGCCYGMIPTQPEYEYHAPSVSWVLINESMGEKFPTGHILPMDVLDGKPILEVALGDLGGDGDQDIFTGRNEPDYQVGWNDGQDGYRS